MKDTDEVNILYMKGRERMKSVSKRYLSFILSLLMAMTIFTGLDLGDINAQALSGDTLKNADTEAILEDMGLGWNLGNSLDATGGSGLDTETSWSNPKTTQALIDKVKSLGFNTVRVPVSWGKHVSGDNYTIDSAWLARVKEVVDYCYKTCVCNLNIHHDTKSSASASGAGYYQGLLHIQALRNLLRAYGHRRQNISRIMTIILYLKPLTSLGLLAQAMSGGSTSGAFRQR